jgi:hypothetical protein
LKNLLLNKSNPPPTAQPTKRLLKEYHLKQKESKNLSNLSCRYGGTLPKALGRVAKCILSQKKLPLIQWQRKISSQKENKNYLSINLLNNIESHVEIWYINYQVVNGSRKTWAEAVQSGETLCTCAGERTTYVTSLQS